MKKHSRPTGGLTAALLGLAASVLILLYVLWAQPSALGDTLSGMFTQPLLLLLNWLPIALLCAALGFALANPMYGAAVVGLITGVMSLINRVKITMRSEPFVPRDIVLVKEAADAMGNYDLSLPWAQAGVLLLLILLFVAAGILLPPKKPEKKRGLVRRLPACSACCCSWGWWPSYTARTRCTSPLRQRSPTTAAPWRMSWASPTISATTSRP